MEKNEIRKEMIDNNKPVVIIAGTNEAKTNLAFYLAKQCSHQKKYTLGYPKKIDGFQQLWDVNALYQLRNCVVLIDEFSRFFRRYSQRHNDALEEALDFAEHRNIKLILTAQNNQAIDRNLESRIKIWILKKLNVHTLKQGGMCKVAMSTISHPSITKAWLDFEKDEFLWFDIYPTAPEENGVYNFPDQGIGKDWVGVTKTDIKKSEKLSITAKKTEK